MFALHRRTLYLLLVMCVGHVLLISVQVQSKSGLPLLESVSFGVFSGAQRGSTGLADGVGSIWRRYLALGGVARENDALKQQIVELEGALASERALSERTRTLEDLLRLQRTITTPTVAARVTAGSP